MLLQNYFTWLSALLLLTQDLGWHHAQECAYICNMAVDERFRRRGYGKCLLAAAERVARLGGQRDLYLHLRAQVTLFSFWNGSLLLWRQERAQPITFAGPACTRRSACQM